MAHPAQSYPEYVEYNLLYEQAVSEGWLDPVRFSNQFPPLFVYTSSSDSSRRSSIGSNGSRKKCIISNHKLFSGLLESNFSQLYLSPPLLNCPQVSLKNSSEWQELHAIGNEMRTLHKGKQVIPLVLNSYPQSSRRLNPTLGYDFKGLSEMAYYCIGIKLSLQNPHQLEYTNGEWKERESSHKYKAVESSKEVLSKARRGDDIMRGGFLLDTLKMSSKAKNSTCKDVDTSNMVSYNSRISSETLSSQLPVITSHSYLPLMTLYEVLPNNHLKKICSEVSFPETQFIAVGEYKVGSFEHQDLEFLFRMKTWRSWKWSRSDEKTWLFPRMFQWYVHPLKCSNFFPKSQCRILSCYPGS